MPKNRKRNTQKGAKSISIRTKFKVGGRKSGRGLKQMSTSALESLGGRPRDQAKVRRELARRI